MPETILDDRPVFIVGAPRSGTTLTCSLLDAHPHLFCPEWETGVFELFERLLEGDLRKIIKKRRNFPLAHDEMVDWARESVLALFGRFAERCGKRRWAEKTPAHVFHIPLIHRIFPRAQFVHIIRNGYEVVRSLQNVHWGPRQIRWSADRWVDSVRAGKKAGAELPAGLYHELRYEQLTADPEPMVRAICEFLHEPFVPAMLEFHRPENNSWRSESQPIQANPINKYKELGFVERFVFRRRAGRLMRELGYR